MAQLNLNQVAVKLELDPKVIRRIIRKELPSLAGKGKYTFDDTNPAYQELVKFCEAYKKKEAKPKKAKKEKKFPPISWDERGLSMIGDGVWTLVFVPSPKDPSAQEAISVYLGKREDVEAVLSGKKPIPDGISDRVRCAFDELMKPTKKGR